jgi:hypothetical protein
LSGGWTNPFFILPPDRENIAEKQIKGSSLLIAFDNYFNELIGDLPLNLIKAIKISKDLSELSTLFNVSREVVTIRLINQNLLK